MVKRDLPDDKSGQSPIVNQRFVMGRRRRSLHPVESENSILDPAADPIHPHLDPAIIPITLDLPDVEFVKDIFRHRDTSNTRTSILFR